MQTKLFLKKKNFVSFISGEPEPYHANDPFSTNLGRIIYDFEY
ncbi:MAG: hypothetical protein ACJA2D_000336 [Pseudohongiellaceae bacterium]|jgi:hypothetical protein